MNRLRSLICSVDRGRRAPRALACFAVTSIAIGCTTVPSTSGQGGDGGSSTTSLMTTTSTTQASSTVQSGSSTSSGGACLDGTFDDDANVSTPCVSWTDCEPGEYVETAGTPTEDRACAPCASEHFTDATNALACEAWTPCDAGTHVSNVPSAKLDRTCAACDSGTFSVGDNAATCTTWQTCLAGTRVTNTPSADTDRICEPCGIGEYTSGPNQSMCLPLGACPAGTVQTAPGNMMMPPTCMPCSPGSYCAGATTPAVTCAATEFDNDMDPATVCIEKAICGSGSRVVSDGSTTMNRTCMGCTTGTFAIGPNAPMCTPWTTCAAGDAETAAGSTTADRTCGPYGWTRQFGSSALDAGNSVAIAPDGKIAVGGYTAGTLFGQTNAGGEDAFLRVYDAGGTILWTSQFGSAMNDTINYDSSVAFLPNGNIVVAGHTAGTLPGQTSAGVTDAFVRVYSASGVLQWTQQYGTAGNDYAKGIAVRADSSFVVGGMTTGTYANQATNPAGGAYGYQAYIRAFSSTGTMLWDRQFGPSGDDEAFSLTSLDGQSIVVAGYTSGALPGQVHAGATDAFLRAYSVSGTELWTTQFGTPASDLGLSVGVGANGVIVLGGNTSGTLPGQVNAGSSDAFVRAFASDGSLLWTTQFGASGADSANGVDVRADGIVLVSGYVSGALPSQVFLGGAYDAYVRAYGTSGALLWTQQYGTSADDTSNSVSLGPNDTLVTSGNTNGVLPTQAGSGGVDAFLRRFVPPPLP